MEEFDLPSEIEELYLLTSCNHNNEEGNRFTLSSISSNKICFEFDRPFLRDKLFIGYQYGFVAVLDQYSEPSLLNLQTGEIISLPSITTVPSVRPCHSANGNLESYFYRDCIASESLFERYIFEHFQATIVFKKVIVSSNPSTISSSGFIVAALIGPRLAIAVPGKGRWNFLECKCYIDIMFRKNGTLICSTFEGAIHEIKLEDNGDDFVINEILAPFIKDYPQKIYLSENCCGCIFLITRGLGILDATFTSGVRVYRCNEEENNNSTWGQVKSLDGEAFFVGTNAAFFVGTNAAFSVKKEDIEAGGLKPDTIYFTDDWWEVACDEIKRSPRDICTYNLTDDSIDLCCPSEHRQCTWPLPIWIDLRNMN